jgi:hypothetical protein
MFMNTFAFSRFRIRLVLALGILLPGSGFLAAQTRFGAEFPFRQEISFGVGTLPFVSSFGEFPLLDNQNVGGMGDLYDVYRTRYTDVSFLPVLSLNYRYALAERISIGVNLSATRAWGKGYNVVSGTDAAKKEITAFYLMPQFRYDYLVSRNWHLFGHVDLGAGYWSGKEDVEKISKVLFAGELVPIGATFGRRFFGGAELVVGTVTYGFRGSIGYRF